MNKLTAKYFSLGLLFLFFLPFAKSQTPQKVLITFGNNEVYAQIRNVFSVVAQQNKPVSADQLSATLEYYDGPSRPLEIQAGNGYFFIRPDSIGRIKISVQLADTLEVKMFRVKPIKAVGRLSRHKGNGEEKIGVGEFKAQMGIIANVECCDINAHCTVLGYQVIRVGFDKSLDKHINVGARFDNTTRQIINKAESGDIYIFRNIRYKCPGADRPHRLDDMIFELE